MKREDLIKLAKALHIDKLLYAIQNGTFQPMYKWTDEKLLRANMRHYKHRMGYGFDIQSPRLFTEKVQWYKFFYDNPLLPYIVDKLTFKQYIEEELGPGYTIPIYCSWRNIDEFERDWKMGGVNLPKEFCLKANLQSDGRCIKIIHDKDAVDFEVLKEEVSQWFKIENTLVNSADRHFYNSTPMVFAEVYMSNFKDQLYDYKFFCFSGEPFCMYTAIEHFDEGVNADAYPIMFYDLDWNKMDVKYGHHPNCGKVPKPKHYEEMKVIARKLSKDFPFVRVDFFDTNEKLYMAELTFNPGGGFVPYYPESFNKKMGDMFILPYID